MRRHRDHQHAGHRRIDHRTTRAQRVGGGTGRRGHNQTVGMHAAHLKTVDDDRAFHHAAGNTARNDDFIECDIAIDLFVAPHLNALKQRARICVVVTV